MRINSFLFLFFIFLLSLYKSLETEIDPDFFWYLKDAEYLLENKKLPRENIYTFLPSKKWVSHSLGFEVFLYLFYKNFSDKGVIFFKLFLLTILFFLIIARIYKKEGEILGFLILFISIYILIFWGTTLRPHIFTYIFSFLLLYILEKEKFFLLTPLLFLWSFFHAGVILGTGISFLYTISEFLKGKFKKGLKVFLFTLTGLFFILLLNPYHFNYFLWIYSAFKEDIKIWSRYITEWENIFSPIFFDKEIYYIISFFIMIFLLTIFIFSKEKKEIFHILIFIFIFYSAIKYVRNIPLFVVISAFILPQYSEKFFKFNLKFKDIEKNKAFGIILTVLCTFTFLKIIFSYSRPITFYFSEPQLFDSFPSRHATISFALSLALIFQNFRYGTFSLALSFLIAIFSWLSLMHWPLDIFIGALLGFLIFLVSREILYFFYWLYWQKRKNKS